MIGYMSDISPYFVITILMVNVHNNNYFPHYRSYLIIILLLSEKVYE